MSESTHILVIEDRALERHELQVILGFLGEKTVTLDADCFRFLDGNELPDSSGIGAVLVGSCTTIGLGELVESICQWDRGLPMILLGDGRASLIDDEQQARNITAELGQPLAYQPLLDALHKARVFREHFLRLRDLGGVRNYNMFRSLVGCSENVQRVREMMGQVADKDVTVLITGESGTGKEVVARNLHLNSSRAGQPFVPINCGAIPRELLESELFGHEKGAFTGAIASREGRFELAHGGTLFLDEIGDMPPSMQVKLLRVLQERSFERVGGVRTISTDVRIIAATHQDLEAMIARGEFRQDLYYRINVFPIEIPPLRERTEDIPPLLNELIASLEAQHRGSVRFNSRAIAALRRHDWPGNVRELANLVERMAILHPNGIVGEQDLPAHFHEVGAPELGGAGEESLGRDVYAGGTQEPTEGPLPLEGLDLKEYLANLEKDLIAKALDDSEGVVARAADRLHIRRTTLVEKMRKYNLSRDGASDEQDGVDEPQDSGSQTGEPARDVVSG